MHIVLQLSGELEVTLTTERCGTKVLKSDNLL